MKKYFLNILRNKHYVILGQRITAMFDDDVVKFLRGKQSKLIKTSKKSVSFSSVLNQTVRKSMKK